MKRISKRKQRQLEEKRINENLFNKLSNLSKEDQTLVRADLLINPIQLTYSINGDSYIKTIVDFKRNGKTLILDCGKELVWKQKANQDFAKYQVKSNSYGYIMFSVLVEKRDPSF